MSLAVDNLKLEKPTLRSRFGRDGWALADQLLVSAANLGTMIFVARGVSQESFGWFTLVYSVLLFANNLQYGLVTQPHNVLGATRKGGDYARYTTSTTVSQLGLSALAAIAALMAWFVAQTAGWPIAPLLLPLAPLIVAWQLQEFVRRVLYTEQRVAAATVNDLVSYGTRIIAIAALWWVNALTGVAAMYTIAATATLGAILGVWQLRGSLARQFKLSELRENWHFGKWLVATEFVGYWASTQLFIYLAAAIVGVAAVAVLKAVDLVFGPARVLAIALINVLPIRLSKTLAEDGDQALHAQFRKALFFAVPLLGGYCVLVAIFARPVLWLLFGDKYLAGVSVLMLYSLYAFVSYVAMIAATALRAKRLTRQVFYNRLAASAISIPIGWLMILAWGVYGAVLGMITTYAALCVFYRMTYKRHVRFADAAEQNSRGQSRQVARRKRSLAEQVLCHVTSDSAGDWEFTQLGTGGQGESVLAWRSDGRPICGTHDRVAIKLFDHRISEFERAICDEFELLCSFARINNHSVIDGWTICSPVPLYKCERPAALVMTEVRGDCTDRLLRQVDQATADVIQTSVKAVIGALQKFWLDSGEIYGDLHLENILCDTEGKTVSFVDLGAPRDKWHCAGVARKWYPMSRDLAYLLFDAVTCSVRLAVRQPETKRRWLRYVEQVLANYLATLDDANDKSSLLAETSDCVQVHLSRISVGGKPADIWRRYVRKSAEKQIAEILNRCKQFVKTVPSASEPLVPCAIAGNGGSA